MLLKKISAGFFGENCYIIGSGGVCCIIDPGSPAKEILNSIKTMGLRLESILLTHLHYDHICSVDEIKKETCAKVVCHRNDAALARDPVGNCSNLFGRGIRIGEPDIIVDDGQKIVIGDTVLEVIHTPGHTKGSICFKSTDGVFTGDTLFCLSVGRTDLGGGDEDLLLNSIKTKLMVLPDDTAIYPGHGIKSTIGKEREKNPFLWRVGE